MTRQEILAMKAGVELDEFVAETLGLSKANYNLPTETNHYSANASAVQKVEDKIIGLGLQSDYAVELIRLIGRKPNSRLLSFALAHANPEIRCKAALLARLEGGDASD